VQTDSPTSAPLGSNKADRRKPHSSLRLSCTSNRQLRSLFQFQRSPLRSAQRLLLDERESEEELVIFGSGGGEKAKQIFELRGESHVRLMRAEILGWACLSAAE